MVFRVPLVLISTLLLVNSFLVKPRNLLQLMHSDGMSYEDLPRADGPSHYVSNAPAGK